MKFLGIDTTNKCAKICLILAGERQFELLDETEKQSENLMLHVDNILNKNHLKISDIDVFGVVVGPGSFTGIRVGVATIKAFAYASKKPVVAVSVFDVLAKNVGSGTCILNCTSNSVYFGEFNCRNLCNSGVIDLIKLENLERRELFCLEEEHLTDKIAYKCNVITCYLDLLADAFERCLYAKKFSKNIEPLYLQLSQAERNLEKKND